MLGVSEQAGGARGGWGGGSSGDIANLVSAHCLLLRKLEEQLLPGDSTEAETIDLLLRELGQSGKAAWRKGPLSVKSQVRVQQRETGRREFQEGGTA